MYGAGQLDCRSVSRSLRLALYQHPAHQRGRATVLVRLWFSLAARGPPDFAVDPVNGGAFGLCMEQG